MLRPALLPALIFMMLGASFTHASTCAPELTSYPFGYRQTRVIAGPLTIYQMGLGTLTNRALVLDRADETDRAAFSMSFPAHAYPERQSLLPIHPGSYSRLELTHKNGIDYVQIEEKWGLGESPLADNVRDRLHTHSYNLGGIRIVLVVPIEFTVGNRQDYRDGKAVEFRLTPEGERLAATQFFDSAFSNSSTHYWGSLFKDRAIEGMAERASGLAYAAKGIGDEETTQRLVEEAVASTSKEPYFSERIQVPESLAISFKGTRARLEARFPSPLTFEYYSFVK